MADPSVQWRPEFLRALDLLARVSEAMHRRGLPRPVLVGGGAVELYTSSMIVSGDFDLCSPVQQELEEELVRHGFVKPGGAGAATRGWIHPDLALGFEVVASTPLDGQVEADRMELILLDGTGGYVRLLGVEDIIAERMAQYASGTAPEMLGQARALFALFPKLDREYLERRIRYETAGSYGLEKLHSPD